MGVIWGSGVGEGMTSFGDVENLDPRDPDAFSGTIAGMREIVWKGWVRASWAPEF